MKIVKKNFLVILILFFSTFSSTVHAAEDKESLWFGTFAKKKISDNYSYWLETQVRYGLDIGKTKQILYRTGVLRNLTAGQGLGLLYGYIETGDVSEHRLTLQHNLSYGSWSGFSFSHRARLEGRFIEDLSQDAVRLRLLFKANKKISQDYSLVAYNELFINLNETRWNGAETMDRNRFFLGVESEFLETNKLTVGYLNQYSSRDKGDISEHIVFVGLSF